MPTTPTTETPSLEVPDYGYYRPLSLWQLIDDNPAYTEPVVSGLLRRGETMNIVGSSKSRKSWLVQNLAVAVATGTPWLGRFQTINGNVLLIDNELHEATLARRLHEAVQSAGVTDARQVNLKTHALRGKDVDINKLKFYLERADRGKPFYDLVIVDALYRLLPEDTNENDNAQMMRVYNKLDSYAKETGSAFVVVHHTSKGKQDSKAVTDIGSGAGAISRAADTHVVLRAKSGMLVMESRTRTWEEPPPLLLSAAGAAWHAVEASTVTRDVAGHESVEMSPRQFAESFAATDGPGERRKMIVERASQRGMTRRLAMSLFEAAKAAGDIIETRKHAGTIASLFRRP